MSGTAVQGAVPMCDFGISDAELAKMSVEERAAVLNRLTEDFQPVDDVEPDRDYGDDAWQRGQDRYEHYELGW